MTKPIERLRMVATCALGLEEFLAEELLALGMSNIEQAKGAVLWQGPIEDAWRANLWLRTANRVLITLGTFPARNEEALARGVRQVLERNVPVGSVDLMTLLDPRQTLSVRATSRRSVLGDVRYLALKTKDCMVDAQRARYKSRSFVDRKEAGLPFRLMLDRDRATLSLDTSGAPLDRRGYRVESTKAPVREQLAAACVLAARSAGEPIGLAVDPMCGSGTFLAEAAWVAQGRAPGLLRKEWLFSKWPGFSRAAFDRMREEAAGSGELPDLIGWDNDPLAIRAARTNLSVARVDAELLCVDSYQHSGSFPSRAGQRLVLVNPSYGKRLQGEPEDWKRLGDLLKQRFKGFTAAVLAGDANRGKFIGLRPRRRIPVRHGPLDARILLFDLY